MAGPCTCHNSSLIGKDKLAENIPRVFIQGSGIPISTPVVFCIPISMLAQVPTLVQPPVSGLPNMYTDIGL